MYVELASGGYRAVSQYNGFAVLQNSSSNFTISDLSGNSANQLTTTYTTEADAQAALATFMTQFGVVSQPPA